MAKRVVPIKRSDVHQVATLVGPQSVTSVPVEIVESTPGPVTTLQKLKRYYKGLIALVGSLLTVATQLAPVIPENDKHWVTTGILILTVAGAFLKENEHWIDGTPAEQD